MSREWRKSSSFLFAKSLTTLQLLRKITETESVCLSVSLSVCVCVSFASDSSETVESIIVTFGMLIASDVRMHHVLIILTLSFIQGHLDRNHENNRYLIISETIQAMSIQFAVKIVRIKLYNYKHCQSVGLGLHCTEAGRNSRGQHTSSRPLYSKCDVQRTVKEEEKVLRSRSQVRL